MPEVSLAEFSAFEDKDYDIFVPVVDDPSNYFFDQYVGQESDPFDSGDNSNGTNLFDNDFAFDMDQSSGSSIMDSSSSKSSTSQHQPNHTWRTDLWRHHKGTPTPPSCQKVVHHLRPEGIAITGNELLKLEGKSHAREPAFKVPSVPSITPPVTPSRRKLDNSSFGPVTSGQPKRRAVQQSTHNSTGSPKMMRPSCYSKVESPMYDWTEQFQHFNLQSQIDRLPLSPPLSGRVPQGELPPQLIMSTPKTEADYEILPSKCPPYKSSGTSRHLRTPSEALYSKSMQEAVSPSLVTNHSYESSLWMHSPDSFAMSPDMQAHTHWAGSLQPSALEPSYEPDHNSQQSLQPDFVSTHIDNDFSSQGLFIQCDPYHDLLQDDPSPTDYFACSQQTNNSPHAQRQPGERDYSPSISPSNPFPLPPRPTDPPSPTRTPSSPSSQRSPTRCSKSLHPRHRRQKSSCTSLSSISSPSRSSRKPTTPGTPINPGFVNFTPQDSRKILTGVAPSGSSKTKARREKEAVEKRRRLSEVATRAVMELGGDVELLKGVL